MIRRIMAVLLAGGLLFATWALAQEPQPPADKDEPPLRLKKKQPDESKPDQPKEPKKPAAEDKKPDEPGKEGEPAEPQENEKEVIDRVARNMRSLEERLANKELGEGTRQVGDDIVKDLDALIRAMENPPQGGSGGDAQNDPSGSSNDQKNQRGQSGSSGQRNPSGGGQRSSRPNRGGSSQQPGGGSQQSGSQPKPDRGDGPMGNGQPEKNNGPSGTSDKNGRGGNDKGGDLNKNADLYKDVWGHLPEALRAEMNAYSTDKELIPKYDALIKRCSRTIAVQSTRKAP
jgi:hypothetical protein